MLQQPLENQSEADPSGGARVGDVAAMLRVMRPLNGALTDPVLRRRRLLADLCRLVGVSVGSVAPMAIEPERLPRREESAVHIAAVVGAGAATAVSQRTDTELSPRLEQTLRHLLSGASEKEVAKKLNLSRHTVHVYVKALYRHYRVTTRAELLARHVQR